MIECIHPTKAKEIFKPLTHEPTTKLARIPEEIVLVYSDTGFSWEVRYCSATEMQDSSHRNQGVHREGGCVYKYVIAKVTNF